MNEFNRKDFLKTSALVGVGTLISGNFSETIPQQSTAKENLAVQRYGPARERIKLDLLSTTAHR